MKRYQYQQVSHKMSHLSLYIIAVTKNERYDYGKEFDIYDWS